MIDEEWLDVIQARAPALRAAGILSVSVGGNAATFAPLGPQVADHLPLERAEVPIEPTLDALHDPASYPDGIVPGFAIEKFPTDLEGF